MFDSAAAAEPLPPDLRQQEAGDEADNGTASGGAAADTAAGPKRLRQNASAAALRLDWQAAQALLAAANATADHVVAALASR